MGFPEPVCLIAFETSSIVWGEVEAGDHGLLWDLVEHSGVHSGGSAEQGTEVFPPPCVDATLLRAEPSADRSGVVRGLVGP